MATLSVLGAIGGCAHTPDPASTENQAPSEEESTVAPRVLDVAIRGNRIIEEDDLVSGLASSPQGLLDVDHARLDPLVLEIDAERIEWYYRKQGLFSAEVTDVETTPLEGGVRVTFTVSEGEPTRIAVLRTENLPTRLEGAERLDEILADLQIGARFIHDEYLEARTELATWLIHQGYAHAEVTGQVRVARETRQAAVAFNLNPGPLVRFGKTHVVGLERIPDSTVLARVAWKRGQIFDPALIDLTRSRLFEIGHLTGIEIEIAREGRPAVADITIHAEVDKRRELRLGGGVAADPVRFEIRGRAGYTLVGYFDPLLTIHFDARPAFTFLGSEVGEGGFGGEGVISAERQDFLFPKLRLSGEVGYRISELEAYALRGPRARLALRRPIADYRLVVSLGYEIASLEFYDLSPVISPMEAEAIGLISPYRVGYFDQSLSYDQRDDVLDPNRGYYLELRLEEAGAFSGSLFDYVRGSAEARGYVPISERIVVAGRILYGRVVSGELPITQRYFAGGATSHRGFGYRHLAPSLEEGDESVPFGGPAMFLTSIEGRVDIARLFGNWIGAAAFLDGGDVPAAIGQLDLFDLHWAAGLGLRYNTPVGPVRLDVGLRLNRYGPDEPDPGNRWALHLSLGEAF